MYFQTAAAIKEMTSVSLLPHNFMPRMQRQDDYQEINSRMLQGIKAQTSSVISNKHIKGKSQCQSFPDTNIKVFVLTFQLYQSLSLTKILSASFHIYVMNISLQICFFPV